MCKRFKVVTSLILVVGLLGSAYGQGTGTIMREVWEGIGGVSVSDLTDNANFPDNPTWADEITSLEQPEGDLGSDFGSRIHGYLHPATSGDYTFWIAADDGCELLLSTDDDPANGVVIAGHNSWTGSRQWDNMPEQKSEPIALEAGGKYYISAMFKEGGGGDNVSVAWEG
ncbi:MAG: PA14 domain-containing protein, partial [Planctomycetota bacterium]